MIQISGSEPQENSRRIDTLRRRQMMVGMAKSSVEIDLVAGTFQLDDPVAFPFDADEQKLTLAVVLDCNPTGVTGTIPGASMGFRMPAKSALWSV